MRLGVLLTEDAERDLKELYTYITEHDCRQNADYVLDSLLEVTDSLATAPIPQGTHHARHSEYRQVFFKPYRVIHRHFDQQVVIYVVVDGGRNTQSLLARRLLGG